MRLQCSLFNCGYCVWHGGKFIKWVEKASFFCILVENTSYFGLLVEKALHFVVAVESTALGQNTKIHLAWCVCPVCGCLVVWWRAAAAPLDELLTADVVEESVNSFMNAGLGPWFSMK